MDDKLKLVVDGNNISEKSPNNELLTKIGNVTKDEMINDFCLKAEQGKASFFIGAGISKPYGLPDFENLVREKMDGKVDYKGDINDCPEMMQYILNESESIKRFYDEIKSRFCIEYDEKYSKYLKYISQSIISTIWTTNFDDLIEQSLNKQSKKYIVKRCEDDYKDNYRSCKAVEVLKIHGDIKSEYIIVTKADYDDFEINNKLAVMRLKNDMLSNCIMFIGYSYNDPNIKNIVNSIRQLLNNDTSSMCHYLLLKKKVDNYQLQKLWINDLKRYGIKTYLYEEHDELENILSIIKLKSRGKTIFVTGSHKEDKNCFASKLGEELGKLDIKFNYGHSEGIGKIICNAFAQQTVIQKERLEKKISIYPNPYAFCADWDDNDEILEFLRELRKDMISNTQVLIAFPGGKGTRTEIDLAVSEGCIVIPIFMGNSSFKNIVIEKWPEIIVKLTEIDHEFVDKLMNDKCYVEDIINFLKGIFGDV